MLRRRELFGLIAAPAMVPDTCWIAKAKRENGESIFSHREMVTGTRLNPWMFIHCESGDDPWTGRWETWKLDHHETGYAIAIADSRQEALDIAAAVLPLLDWGLIHSRDDAMALPAPTREAVRSAIRKVRDQYA